MTLHDTLLDRLRAERLVAIVRGRDRRASIDTCLGLADAGVRLIEVSLTTVDALEVIESVAARLDDTIALGAGTVLDADDVDRVRDAGATFAVTPALARSLERARELGLPVLAGAMTPSEIVSAFDRGAVAAKIFPASVLGPRYVRALRDPLPTLPLVPVGGVGLEDIVPYFDAGATAVGVGSPLCGDAPHGGSLTDLAARARRFLDAIR